MGPSSMVFSVKPLYRGGPSGTPGTLPTGVHQPPQPPPPHGVFPRFSYMDSRTIFHRGGAGADLGRLEARHAPADVHLDWDNGQIGRSDMPRGAPTEFSYGSPLRKKLRRGGGGVVRCGAVVVLVVECLHVSIPVK